MMNLNYECESSVNKLQQGNMMLVGISGTSATFDQSDFFSVDMVDKWLRFSDEKRIDYYRQIKSVQESTSTIILSEEVPPLTNYSDVEYGLYFSDWNELNGQSGVSTQCQTSRIWNTLPIDVSIDHPTISSNDV